MNGLHVGQYSFAFGGQFDNFSCALFRYIYSQLFDRLAFLAIDLFDDDVGLTYLQLISFTTHGLDQHWEVQYTTTIYDETIGRGALFDAQG